jgi:hypothetical protein
MSSDCRRIDLLLADTGPEGVEDDATAAAHVSRCERCQRLLFGLATSEQTLAQIPEQEAPPMSTPIVPLTPAEPEEQPRWHLALGDETRGPLTLAEVERFWEDGGIDRDSLVWAEGLSDWVALAEVADLAYLEAYPRAVAPRAAPAKAAAAAFAPVTFRGDEAAPAGVEFKPVAAELAALVSGELESRAAEPPPVAAAGPAPVDLPALSPTWQPPLGADPGWQVPRPEPRRGLRPLHLLLAGLGASLATAAAAAIALVVVRESPAPHSPPQAPLAAPVALAPAPNGPVAPSLPETPAPAALAPVPAATDAGLTPAAKAGGARAKARAHDDRDKGIAREKAKAAMDALFDGPAKAAPTVTRALSADDITAGVKQGMPAVMGCLKSARAAGELAPGTHTLVLDWVIAPSGAVTEARLRGPASVLNTSLPACFARGMRQWRFPPSPAGAPVKNFPFGPFTIK